MSFDAVYEETCQQSGEDPDLKRCHAIMSLMAGEGLVNYNSLELSGVHHLLFENRLRDIEVRAIFAAVKDKSLLQVIDLSCNSITNVGAQYICQFLHGNTTLVALALKGNDLKEEACRLLCQAIKFNRTLKVLDLSHNPLGRKGAMLHLADLLEANEGLDDLDVTRTGIDMPGAAAICGAMRRNAAIQTLRMGDIAPFQTVESNLPSHIGRMLQFNSTLKTLDISKMQLRDEGVGIIAEDLLQYNRSLTSLTLSSNKITMEGAKAVGKLLSEGTTLAHLNLSSNQLGNEGGLVIAQALQYNSGLESLDIAKCGIRNQGLSALAESLARTSMYRFHAWGNEFGEHACQRFSDLMERHAYLKDRDFIITKVDGKLECSAI